MTHVLDDVDQRRPRQPVARAGGFSPHGRLQPFVEKALQGGCQGVGIGWRNN